MKMKYIELFENSDNTVEEFYKDKIDWKFYNYLIDKMTVYEDAGYTVIITVCTGGGIFRFSTVYGLYGTGDDRCMKYSKNAHISNLNCDIYYCIYIKNDNDFGDYFNDTYGKHVTFGLIKNKAKMVESDTFPDSDVDSYLIVKPL